MSMTMQEIYDKVTTHLLTQNARSQNPQDGRCFYHAEDGSGNMCAVGCLITDEVYARYGMGIEGSGVQHDMVGMALRESGVLNIYDTKGSPKSNMLFALQNLHDRCSVQDWRSELDELARRFNLRPLRHAIYDPYAEAAEEKPTAEAVVVPDAAFTAMMADLVKHANEPNVPVPTTTKEGVTQND